MAIKQSTTATIIAASGCTGNGTVLVTVTSARIATNPTALSVAVTTADNTASLVALACRNALALNSVVSDVFQVSGATDKIILTERVSHANDATLNVATANGSATGITAAPTSSATTAGDGLDNAYITLADLKATNALGITDTVDDTQMEDAINATSREIDNYCNRYFYKNAASEVRYFTPSQKDQCLVGDLISIDTNKLLTDSALTRAYADVWATTDYDLYPYNAALNGEPYWRIDVAPNGTYAFAISPKWVKITGVWGWPAVPYSVKQACLLWSMRTWERHKTILGVSGTTALGQMTVRVPPADPDVEALLANYKNVITGVI